MPSRRKTVSRFYPPRDGSRHLGVPRPTLAPQAQLPHFRTFIPSHFRTFCAFALFAALHP